VTFHRKNNILSPRSGLKLEFGAERIEPKEIPVRAVLGRIAVGHALYVKNVAQNAPLV
jgi:hypothetical protein